MLEPWPNRQFTVPIVDTVSAKAIVGEAQRRQDWAAALFVILAIAWTVPGRPAPR